MKARHRKYLAATLGLSLITIAQPTLAQNAPSQQAIAGALHPIPPALRGGQQGLPTLGSAMRPEAAPKTRHNARAFSAKPAARPGCPAQPDSSTKPMIGFGIAFEFGSAQIKPEAYEVLRNLGKALNEDLKDQKLFEIEGHTDAVGTLPFNEELSRLRAEAVKEFLVRQMGVSPERLAVVGKGFCAPANPRDPYAAENRRVVVINQTI